MEIKNKDLQAGILNISSLSPISMDGDITMAAIKRRRELISIQEDYQEAKTKMLESFAKKDDNGNPVKNTTDMENGSQIVSFEFDNTDIQNECLKKCTDLDNISNVITDGTIESSRILSFRTTPGQLEGLLLISKPE